MAYDIFASIATLVEGSLGGAARALRLPGGSVHYELLIPTRSNRNRKLTPLGGKKRADEEANMLDVAFVALGIAVLALMGVYALALRQV
jgi:hypothetical protein